MKTVHFLFLILFLFSCSDKGNKGIYLLEESAFSHKLNEKEIRLYTLTSGNGIYMQVTNYGLRVVNLWTPDRDGNYADIVLGYENIHRYIHNHTDERFLGCVVGRYANRIARGKFDLDGIEYKLTINNYGHTLHGGSTGFDRVVWNVDRVSSNAIDFSYVSLHGEDGFPGTVKTNVTYELTPENEFKIIYKATTDKATVLNLSHHSYFNLKGEGKGTIEDHQLTIYASNFTEIDSLQLPTGKILPVQHTPFDFREAVRIGKRINNEDPQLKNGLGYDHNWILDKSANEFGKAAELYEPVSGRKIEIFTDQPGIQFYSGNFFDGEMTGRYGNKINHREALTLETQKFPDSPNQPHFPSTRLNPGEVYSHLCMYKFSVK